MRSLTSSLESSQCRCLILLKTELETWERSAFISEAFWLHVKVWVYIYISFFCKTTDLRLVHLLVAAEWFCRIVKKKKISFSISKNISLPSTWRVWVNPHEVLADHYRMMKHFSPGCGLFYNDSAPIHREGRGLTGWFDENGDGENPTLQQSLILNSVLPCQTTLSNAIVKTPPEGRILQRNGAHLSSSVLDTCKKKSMLRQTEAVLVSCGFSCLFSKKKKNFILFHMFSKRPYVSPSSLLPLKNMTDCLC